MGVHVTAPVYEWTSTCCIGQMEYEATRLAGARNPPLARQFTGGVDPPHADGCLGHHGASWRPSSDAV